MTREEIEQILRDCQESYTDRNAIYTYVDIPKAAATIAEAIEKERQEAIDSSLSATEMYNKFWGLLYPDAPTSWEYPGQVYNHIRLALQEKQHNDTLPG